MSPPREDAYAEVLPARTLLVAGGGQEPSFDWRAALARLWPRRRTLVAAALGGAFVALGLSFVLPPAYDASVTLVEAQDNSMSGISPQLGMLEDQFSLHLNNRASGVSTYPEIVRSRQLLTRVLLQALPTAQGRSVLLLDRLTSAAPRDRRIDIGVRRLRQRVDPALDRRTGILTIRARMDDPVLAASVATAVCATLQELVMRTMNTQAGANRAFIDGRLADARRGLARSEDALRVFRESNLRGTSPRVLTEEARLLREVRMQEEVMLTLTRQYEIACVEEQKNVPVINVLDPAVPPAFRSAPRRVPMTVLGLMLGLVVGASWVLLRQRSRPEAPADAAR